MQFLKYARDFTSCEVQSENGRKAHTHTRMYIFTLSGVSRKHIKKLIGCKVYTCRAQVECETGNYAELNEISLKFYADFDFNMQQRE